MARLIEWLPAFTLVVYLLALGLMVWVVCSSSSFAKNLNRMVSDPSRPMSESAPPELSRMEWGPYIATLVFVTVAMAVLLLNLVLLQGGFIGPLTASVLLVAVAIWVPVVFAYRRPEDTGHIN